jgi:hypothetical protein
MRAQYLLLGWWYEALKPVVKTLPVNQERNENTLVKKSTRRSWALTAAVALLASVFGTAPAQAAGEVTLGVAKGDIYAVTTTDTFKMNVALGVGVDNAYAQQVKVKVANAAGATLSWTVSGTGVAAYYEGTSTSMVASAKMDATTAGTVEIALSASSTVSATTSVVVTAFVDADNDGVVDTGEWSAERTVTFVPYAGVTGTAVMGALAESGDNPLDYTATYTFTNVNIHEMDDTLTSYFSVSNVASGSEAVTVTTGVATVSGSVSAAATFSADVLYNGVKLLTTNTVASTDRTVDAISVSAVKGANIVMSESGKATARVNSAFTVQMLTTTSSSDLVGVATSGTFKVTTNATLGTGVTLTVGGVTHTTTSTLPTSSAFTTGADGKATLALATAGFSTSETVTVEIKAQNYTSTLVISQAAAKYTTTNTDGDYAWSLKAGSLTLNYGVKDQWGEAPAVTQRIKVAFTGTGVDIDTAYAAVNNGVASVTVTANPATLSGDVTATSTLEEQDKNGYWAADSAATNDSAITWKVSADSPMFTSKPASDSASISGATATISATANLAGAVVTVTGAGLTFTAADGSTTSDSLVYRAGNAGSVTIPATSKVAGDYPVTVQIGTYSHAIVITIDDIDAAAATVMSITQVGGGSYVTPGSTLRVKVTMTDANGNLAKNSGASLSMTVTGPGFVGTLPTKTDKNGEATLNVLVGANDTGTIKVEGSFAGTKTVTSSAEFTIGTAPVADADKKITVGTFKGYIAIYTKGYDGSKLSAKVAGKWLVVPSLDESWKGNDYSRTVRFTGAGYEINVHLYIDGEFVRTDVVTTK